MKIYKKKDFKRKLMRKTEIQSKKKKTIRDNEVGLKLDQTAKKTLNSTLLLSRHKRKTYWFILYTSLRARSLLMVPLSCHPAQKATGRCLESALFWYIFIRGKSGRFRQWEELRYREVYISGKSLSAENFLTPGNLYQRKTEKFPSAGRTNSSKSFHRWEGNFFWTM